MPERKGTVHARRLFFRKVDEDCLSEWYRYLSLYINALEIVSLEQKRPNLVELDRRVHITIPEEIRKRTPQHMIHQELADVMKWKLSRGKFRPLQKLVESNTSLSVVDASTDCFRYLNDGNWEEAFESITKLRGVGVATASALCSLLSPELCPFMADEVLESVNSESREYSMRSYTVMREQLLAKAAELGGDWNTELVGRAMWTCGVIESYELEKKSKLSGKKRPQSTASTCTTTSTSEKGTNESEDSSKLQSKRPKK